MNGTSTRLLGHGVDPEGLARACAVRGITGADLRRIGGFSKATLANLRAGRPVRPGTLLRLNATLARFPVLDELPDLVIGRAVAVRNG